MEYPYSKYEPGNQSPEGDNNLLNMVETVSTLAEKTQLDFTGLLEKHEVKTLADFLSVSPRQAILFAVMVDLGIRKNVTIKILSDYFDCRMMRLLGILGEFEELENRFLVRRRVEDSRQESFNDFSFIVNRHSVEALRKQDKTLLKNREGLSFPKLLDYIKDALREREDCRISTRQLFFEIEDLMARNQNHTFVQYLGQKLLQQSSKAIAMWLALERLTGKSECDLDYFTENIFDDFHNQLEFRRHMVSGKHELLRSGVAGLSSEPFINSQVISLTKEAAKVLYQDYPELIVEDVSKIGVIPYKNIKARELYFNPALQNQVKEFVLALGKRRFQRFKEISQKSGLNPGLAAILYGHPGTGKTELALQIARKTRRDLFMVDLSETRSMWFGQSEKQVKQIFKDYRDLLSTAPIEPILFINEADGLFSKRLDIVTGSSSTTHTQNLMQNILLQEMENFNGILIATSNLTENIDNAFERRFLLKIGFTRPDENVRKQIWLSKLPELTPEMACTLAHRFDLTGAQIDNQVKQLIMKRVMHKNIDLMQTLIDTCEQERGFTERKRIGFN